MTVAELLKTLEQKNVHVWKEGEKLRYTAPKGVVAGEVLNKLKSRKAEILAFLEEAEKPLVISVDPLKAGEPFPLTDLQAAYLVGRTSGYDMGNIGCHVYLEFERSDFSLENLQKGWNRLVRRHGMLRAVFLPDGTQRMLEKTPEYAVAFADLSGVSEPERDQALMDTRSAMSHQVFKTDQWPLFDIRVSKLPEGVHRIHFSIDQLIADGFSLEILFRELAALCKDPDAEFKPVSLSFRDYVLGEKDLAGTPQYEKAKEYWFNRLENMPAAPSLPLAVSPDSIDIPHFHCRSLRFPKEKWDRIKARCAQARVTPTGALLAVYATLLARWSRDPQFTINMTAFNRLNLHPEVMDIVGEFTSVNLLSLDYVPGTSFEQRAREVQKQLWDAIDNQSFNGIQVMRELARRKGPGGNAAMPVVFTSTIGVGPAGEEDFDLGKFGKVVYHISQTPQVWLDYQITEVEGALICNWDSADELFPEGMLDSMFKALGDMLDQLAAGEEAWTGRLNVLIPELELGNNEEQGIDPAWSEATLDALVRKSVAEHAKNAAVIDPGRTLSYEELDACANAIAGLLKDDADEDRLVAVVMKKGWEQVAAVCGVLYAGSAYQPLDPALPKDRLHYLLKDGQAKWILTTSDLADQIEWPEGCEIVRVDALDVSAKSAPVESGAMPDSLAYVIHTSGSTGTPKGVAITHRAVINTLLAINRQYDVRESDRVFAISQLNFDLSVFDIFGSLLAGAAIVFPGPDEDREASAWVKHLRRNGVTIWNSVPALMQMLCAVSGEGDEDPVANLRLVLMSGDWIPLDLPDAIRAKSPACQIVSLGGATEASIWSISYPIGQTDPAWKSIPYGKALPNQGMHVLNAGFEPCPAWVPGELYISGLGLAKCYWHDPVRTGQAFSINPANGRRLYRTGDWARVLPDGSLEFLGRQDTQVKIRGHRIELGEIEATLKGNPAVKDAVVTVSKEESGVARLVAHVVPGQQSDAGETQTPRISWMSLMKAGTERAALLPSGGADIAAFLKFCDTLDQLSIAYMCRTLLGFNAFAKAETLAVDDIVAKNGILPVHRRLLLRWLLALCREGFLLNAGGDAFTALEPLPVVPVDHLWEALRNAGDVVGDTKVLVRFMERSFDSLGAMFTGAKEPQKLLFPEGDMEVAESVYETNPMSAYFHHILQGMAQAVAKTEGTIRVLEVGAGVGASSMSVLPALPADRSEYWFTDISTFFLKAAREKFRQYPFIQYGLFDINKSPEEQGYELESFDVVIANNVLHNAVNIRDTLRSLRSLLGPGGCVFILDQTGDYLPLMTTLEFLIDFGDYTDERRKLQTPFFTRDQWLGALAATGYGRQVAFPKPGHPYGAVGQHCLVGQSTIPVNSLRPAALQDYLASKLPRYMVPELVRIIDAIPLSATGKVDRKALAAQASFKAKTEEKAFLEPATDEEIQFAGMWKDLLGKEQISMNDNFFELGGDSLLLTKLLAKMREAYGSGVDWENVSFRSLFEAPTVEGMLALLQKERLSAESGVAGAGGEPVAEAAASFVLPGEEMEHLDPLRTEGDKTPLFLACDARNTTFIYRNFPAVLKPGRPIFALRLRPGTGYMDIEEIAARYVREVKKVQPEGPYLLGGFCMGGIVSYEMAQQLERAGDRTALVTLISSSRSHFLVDDETMVCFMLCTELEIPLSELGLQISVEILTEVSNSLGEWYRRGGKAGIWLDCLDPVRHAGFLEPYRKLASLSSRGRLEVIYNLARKQNHPYLANLSLHDFEEMFALYKQGVRAVASYRPQPYDQPILVLRPRLINPIIAQLVDSAALWKNVGQTSMTAADVDGGHESCLNEPHVAGLAAIVDRHIEAALKK
ncbi:MAG: amino acid adenylation domain-containing protein [Desulfovibrio sp.]|nr:amino acid adenylation domain-containing protein [Desulfovibrio sp.]